MEQGQSDSWSRLVDDLLAGLESSEPRQLKWSLKLEPTCREQGVWGGLGRRKTEGGRSLGLRRVAAGSHCELVCQRETCALAK